MADVEFTAGFQDLKDLARLLKSELPKSASDFSVGATNSFLKVSEAARKTKRELESYKDLQKALKQDASMGASANQAYYNSILKIGTATKSASQSASNFKELLREQERVQKESIATTQREAKELERLRQSYDPLYRASQLYAKQEAELQALMNSGVGSTRRYQQALDQLNKEYQDFGNGVATATNRFASNARGAQKGMNGLGMAMQQTGYQVGDFLVQVQGGTNPMVAFGQQATQLVGVLYLLPPATLAATRSILGFKVATTVLIAGLGIAIPLLTAIGAAWMRTRKDNDEAAKGLKTLNEELKSLDSTLQDWVKSKKASELGVTVEELLGVQGIESAEQSVVDAQKKLESLKTSMSGGSGILGAFNSFVTGGAALEAAGLKQIEEALVNVTEARVRLANLESKIAEDKATTFAEEAVQLSRQIELQRAINKSGSDGAATKAFELEQEIMLLNQRTDLEENAKADLERRLRILFQEKEAYSELTNSAKALASELGVSVQHAIAIENSEVAYEIIQAELEAKKLAEQLGISVDAAKTLSSVDMASGIASAAAQASVLADELGIAYTSAYKLALLQNATVGQKKLGFGGTVGETNTPLGMPTSQSTLGSFGADGQVTGQNIVGVKTIEDINNIQKPTKRRSGGGGSSKKGPSARSTEGISTFVQNLIGTQEGYEAQIAQAEAWKEDAFARMKDFNEAELEILGGQAEAKLLIEEEFQNRLEKLQKAERDAKLSGYQSMFSDLSSLMQTENTKLFKIGQAAAIAEASISGYRAAVEAWEWGMATGGPPMAAAASAASLVKTGVLISSIASQSPNGGGGTGGSGGGSGAIATPTAQEQQGPQEVLLRGLRPGMRLSPEELQEVFDQIYDENDRRGTIFRVDLS